MKKLTALTVPVVLLSLFLVGCPPDQLLLPNDTLAPSTRIYTPTENQTFTEGDTISFTGRGSDREDGILPEDSLVWSSSIDGRIGTGTSFTRIDLTPGGHTISLTATDSDGKRDTSTVTIQVEDREPVRILFLGNSNYFYNDFPDLFRQLAEAGNKEVIVDSHNQGGAGVQYHANSEITEAKINSDQWDYVVVHGLAWLMAFPETHHEFYPPYQHIHLLWELHKLRDKIKANREETVFVYSMPWAYEDGLTWLQGRDEDYFEMQRLIYTNTIAYSDMVPFVTAPAGWAWNRVMHSIWGEQPHYLFMPDMGHPNRRGTFLLACVMYSTLFKESPAGIPFQQGVTANEARYFKNVAEWIVMDNLELWNIIP